MNLNSKVGELGLRVQRNLDKKTNFLSQGNYSSRVLEKFKMNHMNFDSTSFQMSPCIKAGNILN